MVVKSPEARQPQPKKERETEREKREEASQNYYKTWYKLYFSGILDGTRSPTGFRNAIECTTADHAVIGHGHPLIRNADEKLQDESRDSPLQASTVIPSEDFIRLVSQCTLYSHVYAADVIIILLFTSLCDPCDPCAGTHDFIYICTHLFMVAFRQ